MRLLAALAIVAIAVAPHAESLKATSNRMLKKVSSAMMHKDFKAMGAAMKSVVAPGFKYTESGKSMSYEEMAKNMKEGIGMLHSVKHVHASVLSATEHGKTGYTKTTHTIEATTVGPDHKTHKISMTGTSKDTWVKIGGKWKMTSMTWLSQSMKQDGKPMTGMGQ